jgi:hypothetical protein
MTGRDGGQSLVGAAPDIAFVHEFDLPFGDLAPVLLVIVGGAWSLYPRQRHRNPPAVSDDMRPPRPTQV